MSHLIVLDASHGGFDNGATHEGRKEKDDVLKLTLSIGEKLKEMGFDIYYVRNQDVYASPVEKSKIANDVTGDLLVSIHRNNSTTPNTYTGVETYVRNEGGIQQHVAKQIVNNLEEVGFVNLGVNVRACDALLKRAKLPAVMVAVGFINTEADNKMFDAKFDEIVFAISKAIVDVMNNQNQKLSCTYRVQVGGFRGEENARRMAYQLFQDGYQSVIISGGPLYLVQVGELYSLDEAVTLEHFLRLLGYDTHVICEENSKDKDCNFSVQENKE